MGYYTDFNLTATNVKTDQTEDLKNEIQKFYFLENGFDSFEWFGNAKWYDCDSDMKLLSAKFSDVLFTLRGSGEAYDDLWIHYFKNGLAMYDGLQIIENDFDESKLTGTPVENTGQGHSFDHDKVYSI